MLSLLAKDFKLLFSGNSQNKVSKLLSYLFAFIVAILFIVIEVYLFQAIFNKMEAVKGASTSYFSLFLFIVSSLLTVFIFRTLSLIVLSS